MTDWFELGLNHETKSHQGSQHNKLTLDKWEKFWQVLCRPVKISSLDEVSIVMYSVSITFFLLVKLTSYQSHFMYGGSKEKVSLKMNQRVIRSVYLSTH